MADTEALADLLAERDRLRAALDDADSDAHRLALELECLLLDRDIPVSATSRWWESSHEALTLHRQRLNALQALAAAPVQAVPEAELEALRKDAERYRWLRDGQNWPAVFGGHDEPEPLRGAHLDAAIDAELALHNAQVSGPTGRSNL